MNKPPRTVAGIHPGFIQEDKGVWDELRVILCHACQKHTLLFFDAALVFDVPLTLPVANFEASDVQQPRQRVL